MPSYSIQYYAGVFVAMLLAGLAILQAADPTDFGLTVVQGRWVGVVAAMLGVLAGALPSWRRPPVAKDDAGPKSNPDPMPRDE
jgi:hypothetical protein